jgi:hypothetical protein
MIIHHDDKDGEQQNTGVEIYEEDAGYILIENYWSHDADGVLIPRARITDLIRALGEFE